MSKVEILMPVSMVPKTMAALDSNFVVHKVWQAKEKDSFIAGVADRIRGIALGLGGAKADRSLIERLPHLEIIANFGVGYDGVDTAAAAERGIIVTNSPDVLTEEVADTALGLLIMTVRELAAADQYLRAGRWAKEGPYRLTPGSLRDRTVGIAGLGRIGLAIARRLDAMQVPVVYHNRSPRPGVSYPYYASLREMAEAVDTLMLVLPGGAETRNAVNAEILAALGANGILINVGRGNAVDEAALIAALRDGTILAAGLDVFAHEPHVPEELIALPNTVLLPHVASASVRTRDAMGQLVVDNLTSWFEKGHPVTPVAETPWPRKG